jgi:hypothetical protein
MKIQLNLSEEENEIISIYKIKQRLRTKAEAIKRLIVECGATNENSTQTNISPHR